MSALMGIRTIYVFSHDSVALGEDGPTHQPIEHLNTLRSTPNMHTWRPATLVETAVSWKKALENKHNKNIGYIINVIKEVNIKNKILIVSLLTLLKITYGFVNISFTKWNKMINKIPVK